VLAVTLPTWLDADRLKTIVVLVIGALLAFSVVSALVIKAIVTKVITLGVLLVVVIALWTQRASLQDCADRVRAREDATCSFFGLDVQVPASRARTP
jgi:hypothetical protein